MNTKALDKQMQQRRRIAALKAKHGLIEVAPPGFFTMHQLSKMFKKCLRNTQHEMQPWVNVGKAEVRHYKVSTGVFTKSVPHYRLDDELLAAYGIKVKGVRK